MVAKEGSNLEANEMIEPINKTEIAKEIHVKLTAPGFSGGTVEISGDDVWMSHREYPTVRITWEDYEGIINAIR